MWETHLGKVPTVDVWRRKAQTVGSEEAEQWAKEWGPMVEHSPNMYEVPGSIPSGPSKKTEKQNNNKN